MSPDLTGSVTHLTEPFTAPDPGVESADEPVLEHDRVNGYVILLLAGIVLVAAGALGAIAGAGRTARIAAAATGLLCVVAGVILMTSDSCTSEGDTIEAAVLNQNNPGQLSERIRVFLDGHDAGVIAVDAQSPDARLPVTLKGTCRHRYRLEVRRQNKGDAPKRIVSSGAVGVHRGDSLYVISDPDHNGRTYLATKLP